MLGWDFEGANMQTTLASRANTPIGWKLLVLFGRRKTFTEHNCKSCVSGWYSIWLGMKAFGSTPYSGYQPLVILNLHHVISGNGNVHVSAKDLSLDSDKFGNMVVVSFHPKSSEHGEHIYLRKKVTGHAGGRAGPGWARIWLCWARWAVLGAWDLAVLGVLGWVGRGIWLWWACWAGLAKVVVSVFVFWFNWCSFLLAMRSKGERWTEDTLACSNFDTFQAWSNMFSMSEGMLWSQTWRVWTYIVFRIPPCRFDVAFAGTDEGRTGIW